MKRKSLRFTYIFEFSDVPEIKYELIIDSGSLRLSNEKEGTPPAWTRLEYKRCACCTLEKDRHRFCPIALNLVDLIETFKDVSSYSDCKVTCVTAERAYSKNTSAMEGLTSIFGVIMATSDCPVMSFFRPMARFHLPFSTIEETMVRVTSFYMLQQFLKARAGLEADPSDLRPLEAQYKKVEQVNQGLLARIEGQARQDADKNAIVTLHSLAQFLSMEFDYNLDFLTNILPWTGPAGDVSQ